MTTVPFRRVRRARRAATSSSPRSATPSTARRSTSSASSTPTATGIVPLEANATMDAEYIFFMHFMGRVNVERQDRIVAHLLATQLPTGAGRSIRDAPGHLSNTIEAYFAMKLAGLPATNPALARARTLHSRPRRSRQGAGLHALLSRLLRPVPLGRRPGHAGRAGAAAGVVPDQHLRDVELGARHGRAAGGADGEAALRADRRRARRRRALGASRRCWPTTPSRADVPAVHAGATSS